MKTAYFVLILLFIPLICSGEIFHVPADYVTIQAGLNAAVEGDTVLVADGTYTGMGNRNIFLNRSDITIRSQSGPENCVIDCNHMTRAFSVVSGAAPILQGFTIQNGFGGHAWADAGGGISVRENSAPIIDTCIIQSSRTFWGGGITCLNSSPEIVNCIIRNNIALEFGGGIHIRNSNPTIDNCRITGNSSDCDGGGIYITEICNADILNCVLEMNEAGRDGGGIFNTQTSYTDIWNCAVIRNIAGRNGGGAYFLGYLQYPPNTIHGSTFADNTAGTIGGGVMGITGLLEIRNSIFWTNSPTEIYEGEAIELSVMFCDVMGDYPGDSNFSSDPFFVAGPYGDYYLSQIGCGQTDNSPCLDAGSDLAVNICTGSYGQTICMDVLTTCNVYNEDSEIVDIGVHYPMTVATPTVTPTPTVTSSPTLTPSPTVTSSPTCTPTPLLTHTPTETPTETPTHSPTPFPWTGTRLTLSQSIFEEGDLFTLVAESHGDSGSSMAHLWVLLDVYGDYFFWPGWSRDPQFTSVPLSDEHPTSTLILSFLWPIGDFGSAYGLKFWGAILDPVSQTLIGNFDSVEFGYW